MHNQSIRQDTCSRFVDFLHLQLYLLILVSRIPTKKYQLRIVATITAATAPSIETVPANAIDSSAIRLRQLRLQRLTFLTQELRILFDLPASSNTFTIIAVLLMDSAAAK